MCQNKNIIAYLENKKVDKFTGSIKLTFEKSKISSVSEANRHDLLTSFNFEKDIIFTFLEQIKDSAYYGSVVFVYEKGIITAYAYTRTYKDETLKNLLGG